MEPDDLPLLREWLQRPRVRQWWSERETFEEVVDHYLPAIEGTEPTDLYLALTDERPIGFMQTYLVSDHPDYAALIELDDGVAGVDLFVADATLTGQGLGSEMLSRFVDEIVFARTSTTCCIADPDVRNVASLRAFEKAGFRTLKTFVDPNDGEAHALVYVERQGAQRAPR